MHARMKSFSAEQPGVLVVLVDVHGPAHDDQQVEILRIGQARSAGLSVGLLGEHQGPRERVTAGLGPFLDRSDTLVGDVLKVVHFHGESLLQPEIGPAQSGRELTPLSTRVTIHTHIDPLESEGRSLKSLLDHTVQNIGPLDPEAMRAAEARQAILTKPTSALGRLETLSIHLAGIAGQATPTFPDKVVAVMAADHGVTAEGVSAYPAEVTPGMVANFAAGGAAINVIARHVGARVIVTDVGVNADISALEGMRHRKIRMGTANMAQGPAMTREEAIRAIEIGIELVEEAVAEGASMFATGEMGIGNTTASFRDHRGAHRAPGRRSDRPRHRDLRRRPAAQDRRHREGHSGEPARSERPAGRSGQGRRARDRRSDRGHPGGGRPAPPGGHGRVHLLGRGAGRRAPLSRQRWTTSSPATSRWRWGTRWSWTSSVWCPCSICR